MRFGEAILPHCEGAVIVDTGSKDGTREALEELQGSHPQLQVYDHPFEGYGPSRNRSLGYVQTRRALVLDADELIIERDWIAIARKLAEQPSTQKWEFKFVHLNELGNTHRGAHTHRLFDVRGAKYKHLVFEQLHHRTDAGWMGVKIYHFLPSENGIKLKRRNWYNPMESRNKFIDFFRRRNKKLARAPSTVPGFDSWKEFNPLREKYQ